MLYATSSATPIEKLNFSSAFSYQKPAPFGTPQSANEVVTLPLLLEFCRKSLTY